MTDDERAKIIEQTKRNLEKRAFPARDTSGLLLTDPLDKWGPQSEPEEVRFTDPIETHDATEPSIDDTERPDDLQARWDAWADARIAAALEMFRGEIAEALAGVLGEIRKLKKERRS
jgi:hypothetical protein